MFKRILLITVLTFSVLQAQETYRFLNINPSAKSASMAGSFVANNDDPAVLFFNPAGIKNLEGFPVSFTFTKYLLDVNSASIAATKNIENYGKFGAAISYINYGDFTRADRFGNKLGDFSSGEFLFLIGYSNQIDTNFNYGVNLRYIFSSLDEYSSSGIAADIGIQYLFPKENIVIGFSAVNMGGQISKYLTTTEKLPLNIRFGASKKLAHIPLKIYLSFNRLNQNSENFGDRFKSFSLGGEFALSKYVMLRLGYDNEKRKELKLGQSRGLAGINVGLGVKYNKYFFDYAFSSFGKIGAIHRIGITTNFE